MPLAVRQDGAARVILAYARGELIQATCSLYGPLRPLFHAKRRDHCFEIQDVPGGLVVRGSGELFEQLGIHVAVGVHDGQLDNGALGQVGWRIEDEASIFDD
jgi:hypothetical protein